MKRFLPFMGILLVLACFFSCASGPKAAQNASPVWKVTRNGNTLFLGGSVHVLRAEDYPLPKQFDAAFDRAALLVLEADAGQMQSEDFLMALSENMLLPEGQTLRSLLDDDVYRALEAKCASFGIPIASLSQFKPSMVITTLESLGMRRAGFTEMGADFYYYEKAAGGGKKLEFLETVEFQLEMLLAMADGNENDYVKYSLNDIENAGEEIALIVSEWKKGESAAVEASIAKMREDWPSMYERLLFRRNADWKPKLEQYLNTKEVELVIVGLAHLYGPDGLLAQLEKAGCTVERFVR